MSATNRDVSAESRRRHAAAMEAGEPGYLDPTSGLFVFTASHHLKRGTCCGSACRHCPFGHAAVTGKTRPSSPRVE